ncbi:hypothetical protein POJ06DRAFT_302744 [Lipomyces tetrasporus]|uniref:Uncharacterized protein n=1 Tax=Lipomyces tetrasporus TaxID=54092 RepID=A0AAD7VRP2_9ASCO|nr:uncharacterized protein POJ06DRAFT_302744 [Lipomyces tetrasporus]KAJ8098874.1 hypothetical protein POJ06DRAFT_302744 [Lipomyces tetrasporus]
MFDAITNQIAAGEPWIELRQLLTEQLKRRTRASDGEEDAPGSIRLFNCTEEALGYALGKPSNSCARHFNVTKETTDRRAFDERGILGAVCRHGHIIRFRNWFATGEPAKGIAWLLKCIHWIPLTFVLNKGMTHRGQSSAIFVRRFFYEYQVFDNAVSSRDRIISVPQGTDALPCRASEYLQELRSPRSSDPWENVAAEVDMDLGMEDDVDGARRSGLEDSFNDDLNFGSVDSDDDELSETEVAEIVDAADDEVAELMDDEV